MIKGKTQYVSTLLVLIVWMSTHFWAMANPVTPQTAMNNARAFLASGKMKGVKDNRPLKLAFTIDRDAKRSGTALPMLYVYNIAEDDGFVVVAGDDVAKTILGYCEHGSADYTKLPCGLRTWLDGYANEIAWAQEHGYKPATSLHVAEDESKTDVPYLMPTYWDQDEPFWNNCKFDDEYSYTGCVATAMAQVMYYWAKVGFEGKTHRAGSRIISGYTSFTNHYDIPSLPIVMEFAWDDMILGRKYNQWSSPWTDESSAAVAELMRYCGQAVRMDYTSEGSGAYSDDVPLAFGRYFGYDEGARLVSRDDMTAAEWADLIYGELAAGRPVIMSGIDEVEEIGHEFVCDGYDASTDKYHFNWGWSGYCDSYFELEALSPGGTGSGGTSSDMGSYNYMRDAVIDLKPSETPDELGPGEAMSATFVATEDLGHQGGGSIGEDYVFKNGVTIAVNPRGSFGTGQNYRVYQGSDFVVTSEGGNITKVVFTCVASNTDRYGPGCFGKPSEGTYSYAGNIGTWEGSTTEFRINAESRQVRMTMVEVTIEEKKPTGLMADVNDDGLINMGDVAMVISYILGKNPNGFVFERSDLNGDGNINMSDVTSIINIILGRPIN